MKANEAPERLWINSPQDLPCGFVDKNSVEYVRKDAIIEKACKFIKDNGSHYIDIVNGQLILKKGIIKDFRKYMIGE